jgi:hypothetical protein
MRRCPIRSRGRPQPKIGSALPPIFCRWPIVQRSPICSDQPPLTPQHTEAVPDEHPTFHVASLVAEVRYVCAGSKLRGCEGSKIVFVGLITAQLMTDSEMMTESAPNSTKSVYTDRVNASVYTNGWSCRGRLLEKQMYNPKKAWATSFSQQDRGLRSM